MYRDKITKLLSEYGVKKSRLIGILKSNRVSFAKKMEDNSFSDIEKEKINQVYGPLIN